MLEIDLDAQNPRADLTRTTFPLYEQLTGKAVNLAVSDQLAECVSRLYSASDQRHLLARLIVFVEWHREDLAAVLNGPATKGPLAPYLASPAIIPLFERLASRPELTLARWCQTMGTEAELDELARLVRGFLPGAFFG
jgi:hypothetical protein